MKTKLLTLPEGVVAVKTQDTRTLKEPMQNDKRYVVLEHGLKGVRTPVLRSNTPFNILERANLISDVYEVLASTIEGVGKKLRANIDRRKFGDNQSADNFELLMLKIGDGMVFEYRETETELIIEI